MPTMPISSFVAASAPHPHPLATNNPGNATDRSGGPVFAHAVNDALNRNTAPTSPSAGIQKTVSSKIIVSVKSPAIKAAKQAQNSLHPVNGVVDTMAGSVSNVDFVAFPVLLAVPEMAPPVMVPPLANDPRISDLSLPGDSGVAPTPVAKSSAANIVAELAAAPNIALKGDELLPQPFAEPMIALFADKAPTDTFAGGTANSTPQQALRAVDGSAAIRPVATPNDNPGNNIDASDSAVVIAQSSSLAPDATADSGRKPSAIPTNLQQNEPAASSSGTATQLDERRVASLFPQILKLQNETGLPSLQVSISVGPDVHASSLPDSPMIPLEALTHKAAKSLDLHPAVFLISQTAEKAAQPTSKESQAPEPEPSQNSSPIVSDHSDVQPGTAEDKNSKHAEATTSHDSNTLSSTFHDATGFSQALASAGTKPVDTGSDTLQPAQTNTIVVGSEHSPASTSDSKSTPAPAGLPREQIPAAAPNHFVDSAKLIEAAGHSEMRIAMDTDSLGPVELRAHMNGDQLGAAITVEKHDAHAVLAVELPSLQQALSDKQFRVEQITLLHSSLNSTGGDAGASAKHDQRSGQQAAAPMPWSVGFGGVSQTFANAAQSGSFDSYGRLSVHA